MHANNLENVSCMRQLRKARGGAPKIALVDACHLTLWSCATPRLIAPDTNDDQISGQVFYDRCHDHGKPHSLPAGSESNTFRYPQEGDSIAHCFHMTTGPWQWYCARVCKTRTTNTRKYGLQHEHRVRYEDSPSDLSGWITLFKEASYGKTWFYVTTKFNPLFPSQ